VDIRCSQEVGSIPGFVGGADFHRKEDAPMRVSPEPLLIWAVVAACCTVVLVAEVALLARVARSAPKDRRLKWLAIGSVTVALCSQAFAAYSWKAYTHFSILGGCRGAPPGVCASFYGELAQTVTVVTALGWAMVAIAVALLLAGAVVLVRLSRSP
jgi:hypothetical protein